MNKCKRCGSYAINSNAHGRIPFKDLDLCDVCYWRKIVESSKCCLVAKNMKVKRDGFVYDVIDFRPESNEVRVAAWFEYQNGERKKLELWWSIYDCETIEG